MENLEEQNKRWGRIFLTIILSFFGIVFLANFFFVKWAFETQTGIETQDAYERGVSYNEELAEARAEDALGWKLDIKSSHEADEKVRLTLTLKDGKGLNVEGAALTARMIRPVHDGYDFSLKFEEIGNGVYEAVFTLPKIGQWELRLLAKNGDLQSRFEERIRL